MKLHILILFIITILFSNIFSSLSTSVNENLSERAKTNVRVLLKGNESEPKRGNYIPIDYDTNEVHTGDDGQTIIVVTHHRRCMPGGSQFCQRFDEEETIIL